MKKPRALTPEEETLWHEANRATVKKKAAKAAAKNEHDASAKTIVPTPSRGRLGGGAAGSDMHPNNSPPIQPSPARGEGSQGKKPHLKPLTQREAKRIFRSHGAAEATLDLHGLTKLDAYASVQQFITRQQKLGRRHVAIITGKGRAGEAGVLRSNLPHWLNEPALRPLISAFAHARAEKGGSGVTHVLLKRAV